MADFTSRSTSEPARTIPEAKERTYARGRELGRLVSRYVRKHLPKRPAPTPASTEPPRLAGNYARLLPLLQLIPTALLILFGISFFWDFPGVAFKAFEQDLALDGLLRMLSVAGLIGFLTNWLAITMLFHPRRKHPVFGQGLIPAQRERVIFRLATAISEELINERIIKAKIEESQVIPRYREISLNVTRGVLEDGEFRRELKSLTAEYLHDVLSTAEMREGITRFVVDKLESHAGRGVYGVALRLYRFVNEPDFQRRIEAAVNELPSAIDPALDNLDHLLDRIPAHIEARSADIEEWATRVVLGFVERLDIYSMIVENMKQYDDLQLERLLKSTSNEQLNYIKYLGGVLGFLGGLVIWQPLFALTGFALTLGVLYIIDFALMKHAGMKQAGNE